MYKHVIYALLAVSVWPAGVQAWSAPGEGFAGELTLGGEVTSLRNPWAWQLGEGVKGLEVTLSGRALEKGEANALALPATLLLLGKTILTTPAGRVGLAPRVTYGSETGGAELTWSASGMADVTLPVTGDGNMPVGHFRFRIQALAMLRHMEDGKATYVGIYDDLKGNGLPGGAQVVAPAQTAGRLQAMFANEGPTWLQEATVSQVFGLSQFNNAALRQVEGVYGASIVADSGQLYLEGAMPASWHVALPVSIEYQ